MKAWYVRLFSKITPDKLGEQIVDAPTAEDAAKKVEGGPVRFWNKDDNYYEYVGRGYLYEVREL